MRLCVATYNLHKGMSGLNRHHVFPGMQAALAGIDADLLFLQEVQGQHERRASRYQDWPQTSQAAALGSYHAITATRW
jgi:endonuclease/exonuclease/phosphatase family metal-dependent hydrolase